MIEQKQVTELLAIVKILVKDKEIEKLNSSQDELTTSIELTYGARQNKITESRKIELSIR